MFKALSSPRHGVHTVSSQGPALFLSENSEVMSFIHGI